MRKTGFMFTPPYFLFEDIRSDVLLKLFSKFLLLAEELEKSLELPDGYGLLWALKWNTSHDSPILPSMFATVSLCTIARIPRALDEFTNPHRWRLGRGPVEIETSPVLICIAESSLLVHVTENEIDIFGGKKFGIDRIVLAMHNEFVPHLQQKVCKRATLSSYV